MPRMSAMFRWMVTLSVTACNLAPRHAPHESSSQPEPVVAARCQPVPLGLKHADEVSSYEPTRAPRCSLNAEGEAMMTYEAEVGCEPTNPWRSCEVLTHQDLRPFLAGHGVYEVHACVEGALPGSLGLKLEWAPDATKQYGEQELIPLVHLWEHFQSTCIRALFAVDDLSLPMHCPARSMPDLAQCTAGADRSNEFVAIADDPATRDARALLVTEYCDPDKALDEPSEVTVVVRDVTYYPEECFCQDDDDCDTVQYCDHDAWPEYACCRCAQDCPGICREYTGPS